MPAKSGMAHSLSQIGVSIDQTVQIGGDTRQVGDLAESLIKRDCAVKDAGNNVGGFGGMLDVIDSLLFTGPIFYFYVKVLLK